MKRFRYIFFAALLAMMWLGINVYADEYDGLDFDYGSVLVQLKPQITDAVSMCSDPFEELNISDATVSVSGANLVTFTKYTGLDPEASSTTSLLSGGIDYTPYPSTRFYSFSLQLSF